MDKLAMTRAWLGSSTSLCAKPRTYQQMVNTLPGYFHLHLVSDATGETLMTIAKAAAVQFSKRRGIEHVHPSVCSAKKLERALQEIEAAPGIVLYTIVDKELQQIIETRCQLLKLPCFNVLQPVMKIFESYLHTQQTPTVAGQHILDAEYFGRINALNFSLAHDDGNLPEDLDLADIIVLGISRTSKTPTSIYLAQRGFNTTNMPLVPGMDLPPALFGNHSALIVGLVATADRISQLRRNRVMILSDRHLDTYVDRDKIAEEVADSRRLCAKHNWPVIDVTRKSVEETAATILKLYHDREATQIAAREAMSVEPTKITTGTTDLIKHGESANE